MLVVVPLRIVDGAAVQTLTLAIACVALVVGALGAAISVLVLARGAPATLARAADEAVAQVTAMRGEWTAQRAGVDAILDSIHTERENVQKANNRLSARSQRVEEPQRNETRDEMLMRLRPAAGIGTQ